MGHPFTPGQRIFDTDGNPYLVNEGGFTAVLEVTAGDGPISYAIGDGSCFYAEKPKPGLKFRDVLSDADKAQIRDEAASRRGNV